MTLGMRLAIEASGSFLSDSVQLQNLRQLDAIRNCLGMSTRKEIVS